MTKTMMALATAATLAVAAVAPSTAEAHWRGRYHGGGAVIGGLALGALAGAAIASSRPAYGYYPAPTPYYAPTYYGGYGPTCYVRKQRFWDGYGWRIRRVEVC